MNKYMLAFVVFAAIASCSMAKPGYGGAIAPLAAPLAAHGLAPIPVAATVPIRQGYGTEINSYNVPLTSVHLQPIAVQPSRIGHAARAAPSLLIAAASRPVATSDASTSIAGLRPGSYLQLAIPSYELLAGDKLNLVGGHANVAAGYGANIGAGRASY